MENPATWTDLHHAICRALYTIADKESAAEAVLSVLEDEPGGTKLTLTDVERIMAEDRIAHEKRIIGQSLTSKLFNAHAGAR